MQILLAALLLTTASTDPLDAKQVALARADELQPELVVLHRQIWEWAEVGLKEERSSRALQDCLKQHGFRVETNVGGMPTAFVASWGSGKPVIALLAEFDALPGMSQMAEPERKPRPGVDAGHACGHSVFGAASTGAALAVKHALERGQLAGTIRLYGTPAEETGIGKQYMALAGAFDDVDVALHWHVRDQTNSDYAWTKAVVSAKFRFKGLSSHASRNPELGRSALDAVELMNVGANYLREHVKEDARIHYVITQGGGQPNVVPPEAEVWYYLRANRHKDVETMFVRLKKIADGAALMTETSYELRIDSDTHEVLPNRVLAELVHENLTAIGAPRFSEEEKAFARRCQETLADKPAVALRETIEPLPATPDQTTSSTDVGEVSWRVPTGGLWVTAAAAGTPAHSWQWVACTGTSIGAKGLACASKTLAATAIDLLLQPAKVKAAQEEFRKLRDSLTYTSLIPPGQKAPTSIR